MIVFLCGKGGSGKDTIANIILKSTDWKRYVYDTTRNIREGETQGVEYNFVSNKDFDNNSYHGRYIEQRTYETKTGVWRYATPVLKDISGIHLIWGSYEQLEQLKIFYKENCIGIFINTTYQDRFDRMVNRITKNSDSESNLVEACRRFIADYVDYKDVVPKYPVVDAVVNNNNNDDVNEVAKRIIKIVENYVENVEK